MRKKVIRTDHLFDHPYSDQSHFPLFLLLLVVVMVFFFPEKCTKNMTNTKYIVYFKPFLAIPTRHDPTQDISGVV